MRKSVRQYRKDENKAQADELVAQIFKIVADFVDDGVLQITQSTTTSLADKQKLIKEVTKQIKACARKEYKFEWALSKIEQIENYINSDELKKVAYAKDLKSLGNARTEVKMDEHDWQLKQPPKPKTANYVITGTALLLIFVAIYFRYKRRKMLK